MAFFALVVMMRLPCASLLCVGIVAAALGAAEPFPAQPQFACKATPRQAFLPEVIAPSAGESPIRVVDGAGGVWQGPGMPIKTVWILERKAAGALRVTGRNLESHQSLTFREGMEGPITSSLVIEAPLAHSMTPGGASEEVMRKFAFVASYVFYPSPGCWLLDAQVGAHTKQIVVEVK